MATLTINPTYVSLDVLFEADLDSIRTPLQNFLNTTKVDSDNFAPGTLTVDNLAAAVQNVVVQSGTVQEFYGTTLPDGYLWADGSTYATTAHPELYNAIGVTYGGSIGVNFKVPDRRGRIAVGRDDMGGVAASRVTEAVSGVDPTVVQEDGGGDQNLAQHTHVVTATADAESAHTHTLTDPGHTHSTISQPDTGGPTTPGTYPRRYVNSTDTRDAGGLFFTTPSELISQTISGTTGGTVTHQHQITGSTGTTGSNTNQSSVQPSLVCNYIIKT